MVMPYKKALHGSTAPSRPTRAPASNKNNKHAGWCRHRCSGMPSSSPQATGFHRADVAVSLHCCLCGHPSSCTALTPQNKDAGTMIPLRVVYSRDKTEASLILKHHEELALTQSTPGQTSLGHEHHPSSFRSTSVVAVCVDALLDHVAAALVCISTQHNASFCRSTFSEGNSRGRRSHRQRTNERASWR